MAAGLRNPYALVKDELVHVDNYNKFMDAPICPGCGYELVYVSSNTRKYNICRAHFRHNGHTCDDSTYLKSVTKLYDKEKVKNAEKILKYAEEYTVDEVKAAMVLARPKLTSKCCTCNCLYKLDATNQHWQEVFGGIAVALKYSEILFISFGDIMELPYGIERLHKKPNDDTYQRYFMMTVNPSKPTVSVSDDLYSCPSCLIDQSKIILDEMSSRSKIKKEMKESFSDIRYEFIDDIDEMTYFTSGPYKCMLIENIWEKDRKYFFVLELRDASYAGKNVLPQQVYLGGLEHACEQVDEWLANKFSERMILILTISNQISLYYTYIFTKRSGGYTYIEKREKLKTIALATVDRLAGLDNLFEDYLTCTFGKFKGMSYYKIEKEYLNWIICSSDVFNRVSETQLFFILDAYLSK